MRTNLHMLNKPELEFLKDNCNFSEDESILLDMGSYRCSDIQISGKLNISVSMVTKRKRALMNKIKSFKWVRGRNAPFLESG